MKKETIITIRVSSEIKAIIQQLAEKDERTVGWMARKLITEALEFHDLPKKPKKKSAS
ncbi:MAG: ribbon-helix-helix protein, CopG family [Thermodesulfovibrionales bacterium]|nr:ribbon-helix-helix protein, CopG family [Thermodesulfovibrionales bacterium]